MKTVLLVDDDPATIEAWTLCMEGEDCQVLRAFRDSTMQEPSGRCSSPSMEQVTPVMTRIIATIARHQSRASR